MLNTVDKVIAVAEQEVGYLEKSAKAYKADPSVLYKKTEGAGRDNYTKYGKEMHELYPTVMDFPAYWCDCFVDWCFQKAYGVTTAKSLIGGDFNDYTVSSAQMYKNKNAYFKSNPKVGDQVFFHNGTRICHTGLVYKVTDSYIYTIEGNTTSEAGVESNGGCVAKKCYKITNSRIDGYGRPKYDVVNGNTSTNTSTNTTSNTTTNKNNTDKFKEVVKELQTALNTEYKKKLVVDGIPGPKTLAATPKIYIKTKNTKPLTVKALQKLLTIAGFPCEADGYFGPKTEAMTKEFQTKIVGLKKPDGVFSAKQKSWKALLRL